MLRNETEEEQKEHLEEVKNYCTENNITIDDYEYFCNQIINMNKYTLNEIIRTKNQSIIKLLIAPLVARCVRNHAFIRSFAVKL